jgi:hypothetical protein
MARVPNSESMNLSPEETGSRVKFFGFLSIKYLAGIVDFQLIA